MSRTSTSLPALLVALLAAACGGGGPVAGAGSAGTTLDVAADAAAEFGAVPDFRLRTQADRELTLADLRGRPWVAAAIFTTCAGPCPRIAASLKRLQEELADTDVRLVAFSVDPEYDTPAVLAEYAERWGADPERWVFLTGEAEAVYELVHQGLWLAAQRDPEAPHGFQVTHKTSLVAVDREGRRRGWYEGTEPEAVDRLRERMRWLAAAGSE